MHIDLWIEYIKKQNYLLAGPLRRTMVWGTRPPSHIRGYGLCTVPVRARRVYPLPFRMPVDPVTMASHSRGLSAPRLGSVLCELYPGAQVHTGGLALISCPFLAYLLSHLCILQMAPFNRPTSPPPSRPRWFHPTMAGTERCNVPLSSTITFTEWIVTWVFFKYRSSCGWENIN